MSGQIVKVRRGIFEACMTCPLCKKLFKEATTISSCLHTFCRKCIYEKLSDEEADCCPVCNIDLGCLPVDKLSQEKEMVGQVVRVKRKKLEACMTCPLCNHLLNEATTISLCLHTFCRKCIHKKLTHEKVDCCPICNMHLGRLPTEKLRSDNYLQDMRAKIFPFKRREVKDFEVMPSVALPEKKKGEQRERARDLQTSRADDLVPQGHGQDDEESLGSQMFTAYSISLE